MARCLCWYQPFSSYGICTVSPRAATPTTYTRTLVSKAPDGNNMHRIIARGALVASGTQVGTVAHTWRHTHLSFGLRHQRVHAVPMSSLEMQLSFALQFNIWNKSQLRVGSNPNQLYIVLKHKLVQYHHKKSSYTNFHKFTLIFVKWNPPLD